jgi:hypothetical protein
MGLHCEGACSRMRKLVPFIQGTLIHKTVGADSSAASKIKNKLPS